MTEYTHDDLTQALIEWHRDTIQSELYRRWELTNVETEAPYNYYGERGFADLYARREQTQPSSTSKTEGHLYEVKADPSPANKTIRQFQRMQKYFFKDESRSQPSEVHYELTLLPTSENLRHLLKYQSLYNEVQTQNNASRTAKVFIFFRHPENIRPVTCKDWSGMKFGSESWWDYVDRTNPEISTALDSVRGETVANHQ